MPVDSTAEAFVTAQPATAGAAPQVTTSSRWFLRLATAAGVVAALTWIISAALTARYYFDATDEGFYLLSYRWWDTELRTYTGAQYLYGPVFEALGYDIAALRIFRLLTVVAVHLAFAVTFMRWLRLHRPGAAATGWWEAAGASVIVASGGMVYSWLPSTPGYNDVALLGALLAAAVVLVTARRVELGRRTGAAAPAMLGVVAVGMFLAKSSSAAATMLVVAVVLAVVLSPTGRSGRWSYAGFVALGALVAVIGVHVVLVPLPVAVAAMTEVLQLVASATNSPTALLAHYLGTTFVLLMDVLAQHAALVVAAVVSMLVRGRRAQVAAVVLVLVGLGITVVQVVVLGGPRGGVDNLSAFLVPVVLMLTIGVLVGGLSLGRPVGAPTTETTGGPSPLPVVLLLAVLPLTQAAGTGNPILVLAVNGFAAWAAVLVYVATGPGLATPASRVLMTALIVGVVVVPTVVATDALWKHPYHSAAASAEHIAAAGVPPLSSVLVDPRQAAEYVAIHAVLDPFIQFPGRRIMAFDELSGVVFAMDGRSVGEAWYSASDPARTRAGITWACDSEPPWADSLPLLLARRELSGADEDALSGCGLDLGRDYAPWSTVPGAPWLTVRLPIAESP